MSADHYAVGKASIRDNAKLLITVFGGVAGVLLAGTPFSGLGELDDPNRFSWALSSLVIAALCLFRGLWVLLGVLQPGTADSSVLLRDFDRSRLPRAIQDEILEMTEVFEREKASLLPSPILSVSQLDMVTRQHWNRYLTSTNKALKEDAHRSFQELYEAKARLNQWVAFTWMRIRYATAVKSSLLLGFLALCALASFAVAVGGEKKDSRQQVIVLGDLKTSSEPKLPTLPPILFEWGSAKLSRESMIVIARASALLRERNDLGVVLYAYTDTTAGPEANRKLALNRAEVVRNILAGEGGVAASRVFIVPLPKTDLPAVTGPEVKREENRAVRMVLVPLPEGR